ncbi:MAG TPA: DUF6092 family protein [Thermomicrobiales bacterium]|nr:DUF6092 family protein [Thermomicrobiales bacterium]
MSERLVLSEDEAFEMLAFLCSAAEISLHEPTYYGTFRLIDAASRLLGFMLERDPADAAFLRRFKDEIDLKKSWMMWDRDGYFAFLREAPAEIAAELRRRADAQLEMEAP